MTRCSRPRIALALLPTMFFQRFEGLMKDRCQWQGREGFRAQALQG
jgi:hypothetical protein